MLAFGVVVETTFVMIKPDGVARGLADEIIRRIVGSGLRVVERKRKRLSREEAEKLYEMHRGKDFFENLIEFALSGDVVLMKVEGENAVARVRELVGPTDPSKAPKGTVRGDWGTTVTQNVVHAADSPENARRELALFFS